MNMTQQLLHIGHPPRQKEQIIQKRKKQAAAHKAEEGDGTQLLLQRPQSNAQIEPFMLTYRTWSLL